jgi:hypothetical protein
LAMFLDVLSDKGRYPETQYGATSPQEKRPGRHAREALLFFWCPIICRVWRSARAYLGGVT